MKKTRKKLPQRTTPKEFERFCAEAERVINKLRLGGWDITYQHKALGDVNTATCEYDGDGCIATLSLNTKRLDNSSPEDLARHEVAHLVIARLHLLAVDRWGDPRSVDREIESIAMSLGRVL